MTSWMWACIILYPISIGFQEIPDEVSDVEQPAGPVTPRATEDAHDGWENFDSPTEADKQPHP